MTDDLTILYNKFMKHRYPLRYHTIDKKQKNNEYHMRKQKYFLNNRLKRQTSQIPQILNYDADTEDKQIIKKNIYTEFPNDCIFLNNKYGLFYVLIFSNKINNKLFFEFGMVDNKNLNIIFKNFKQNDTDKIIDFKPIFKSLFDKYPNIKLCDNKIIIIDDKIINIDDKIINIDDSIDPVDLLNFSNLYINTPKK
jgi:hypothetical protein